MLITCTECGGTVSDKAYACPHCGFPMKDTPVRNRKSNKKMKLPNGFGGISFLKGNYRKPYRAMVTVGHREDGRPITKILKPQGYFETYNEAYQALVEYNKKPEDKAKDLSFQEVYETWSEAYYKSLNKSSVYNYQNAFNYCKPIYEMKFSEIRSKTVREMISQPDLPVSLGNSIKTLLNLIFDYAVENEITDKNYSRMLGRDKKRSYHVQQDHIAFTDAELKTLWKNTDNRYARWVLIQCYTGLRPDELCNIELENINLKENYLIAGSKTEAGKNRVVPIHKKIKPLIKKEMEFSIEHDKTKLLTNAVGTETKYNSYRDRFNEILNNLKLNTEHRPHDPRKTFVTNAKKYQLDEYAIKLIVGHAITDITEKIYTERATSWLVEEVNKIQVPSLVRG